MVATPVFKAAVKSAKIELHGNNVHDVIMVPVIMHRLTKKTDTENTEQSPDQPATCEARCRLVKML